MNNQESRPAAVPTPEAGSHPSGSDPDAVDLPSDVRLPEREGYRRFILGRRMRVTTGAIALVVVLWVWVRQSPTVYAVSLGVLVIALLVDAVRYWRSRRRSAAGGNLPV